MFRYSVVCWPLLPLGQLVLVQAACSAVLSSAWPLEWKHWLMLRNQYIQAIEQILLILVKVFVFICIELSVEVILLLIFFFLVNQNLLVFIKHFNFRSVFVREVELLEHWSASSCDVFVCHLECLWSVVRVDSFVRCLIVLRFVLTKVQAIAWVWSVLVVYWSIWDFKLFFHWFIQKSNFVYTSIDVRSTIFMCFLNLCTFCINNATCFWLNWVKARSILLFFRTRSLFDNEGLEKLGMLTWCLLLFLLNPAEEVVNASFKHI